MSHKGNDSYNEELEILEQDFKDAQDSYDKARTATQDAFEWEMKMKHNFRALEEKLATFKNKEL